MATTPEGKVKDKIKEWLATMDAFYFMNVPCGYGRNGIHDFIACIPKTITQEMIGQTVGMFVSIEAKAEGKFMTPLQIRFAEDVVDAHGIVECVAGTGDRYDRAIGSLERALK